MNKLSLEDLKVKHADIKPTKEHPQLAPPPPAVTSHMSAPIVALSMLVGVGLFMWTILDVTSVSRPSQDSSNVQVLGESTGNITKVASLGQDSGSVKGESTKQQFVANPRTISEIITDLQDFSQVEEIAPISDTVQVRSLNQAPYYGEISIYKNPGSHKIGVVKSGQIFEVLTNVPGWYKIIVAEEEVWIRDFAVEKI